jgi:hypothetical protein
MTRVRSLRGASLCAVAGVPMAAGSLALLLAAPADAVSLGGAATLARPGTTLPLASGGSATEFTVALPANASCSGDTATDGSHAYSYLVKKGTALADVHFVDTPSAGYGIVDTTGTYYGPVNTAIGTGQITEIPNDFEWGPLVTSDGGALPLSQLLYDGSTGAWETGIVCADTHGDVSNDWNTEITFRADTGDLHGFTWSVTPPAATTGHGAGVMASVAAGAAAPPTTAPVTTAGGGTAGNTADSSAGGGGGTGTQGSSFSGGRPSGSGTVGAVDDAAGSDLPVIGAVAAGLVALGAGILVLYRMATRRSGAR